MRPLLALFVRALREHTRARSTYLLRGGIAMLVILFLWLTHKELSWMGATGLRFFSTLVVGNYIVVTLIGLGSFSSAIAEEKEERTLGLMYMANLSPLAILFGKSTSRVATVLLLLMVQFPFAFLAVTMGGVSQTQIAIAFILISTFLFGLANISLFFSVLLPRAGRAAAMTLALLIGITIFGAFIDGLPDWLVDKRHYLPSDPAVISLKTWSEWFWSVHPGFHCETLAEGGYLSLPVARSAAVQVGIGTGFFILSSLLFERFCGSESAYANEGGGRSLRWRWLGRPRRARHLPFVWKDFHFAMGGRLSVAVRLVLYIAGALFLTWINREMDGGVTSDRHLLAEIGFGLGMMAWYFEIAVLALLVWGPEAWGQHIGAVVATPCSLRRLNLEKARAGLIATLPSVTLIVLSLVVGGSQFIGETFLGDQDYAARGPGGIPYYLWRWISTLKWLAQFGALIALIVNFSLRLKWTAIPAAAGIFGAGVLSYELLSFRHAFARGFGRQTIILEAFAVIFVCGLLIYFIGRNTHSLLLRCAAEG